jgi:hypothetical protein
VDPNPSATALRLQKMADALTESNQQELLSTVLSPVEGENERMLALHLLLLNKNTPTSLFIRVATMNDPLFSQKLDGHSPDQFHWQLLEAMTLSALEKIQERAVNNPSLIGELRRIGEQAPSRNAGKIARSMAEALGIGKFLVTEVR